MNFVKKLKNKLFNANLHKKNKNELKLLLIKNLKTLILFKKLTTMDFNPKLTKNKFYLKGFPNKSDSKSIKKLFWVKNRKKYCLIKT